MMVLWRKLWWRFSGYSLFGRVATWLAGLGLPPYKGRRVLAALSERPYFSPTAKIHGSQLSFGAQSFVGDQTVIYQADDSGAFQLGKRSAVHQHGMVEMGQGARIVIGDQTHIQQRVQLSAYLGNIEIGDGVQIAPGCAFYAYNHGTDRDQPMDTQPLTSKGGIRVGDGAWIGYGATLLDGVEVGEGAVIGAGSVVTRSVPAYAIAGGVPAKVIGERQ